ncbi:hypothetical protein K5549_003227 [Capra hircus]|nr:hypothetical protein K5549_003227 [Capra hircus]
MNFQLMYVNMFNKIYFSCQSTAICVLCCARYSLWVPLGKMEGGFVICWGHLTCHCTNVCLHLQPKGYFASHTIVLLCQPV